MTGFFDMFWILFIIMGCIGFLIVITTIVIAIKNTKNITPPISDMINNINEMVKDEIKPQTKKCSYCGKDIMDNGTKCSSCGASVNKK